MCVESVSRLLLLSCFFVVLSFLVWSRLCLSTWVSLPPLVHSPLLSLPLSLPPFLAAPVFFHCSLCSYMYGSACSFSLFHLSRSISSLFR